MMRQTACLWGLCLVTLVAVCAAASAQTTQPTTAPAATQPADMFKLVTVGMVLDKDDLPIRLVRSEFFFGPDAAFTFSETGAVTMLFDLKKAEVYDAKAGRHSLAELQNRAEMRRKDVSRDLDAYQDRELANRLGFLLRPQLNVTEKDGRLSMANPIASYDVETVQVPADRLRRVFVVDQLITLLRADAQNPPFLNQAMQEELAKRGCMAGEIIMTLRQNNDMVKVRSVSKIVPLTKFEQERLSPLLTKTIQ